MTNPRKKITRAAGRRVLVGMLIGVALLNLVGCVMATVQGHFSSNPELPSLDMGRLPLHAALVVPPSVEKMMTKHAVTHCGDIHSWILTFPVGEFVSTSAEALLSQVFVSVKRVNAKASVRGDHDVIVELNSPVVQMKNVCSSGARDLNARLLLSGKITGQGGRTLLGEASIEAERLPLAIGIVKSHSVEVVGPPLEHALVEAIAGLISRLTTKPKFIEYARNLKAPQEAPPSGVPVTPARVITAPPIY